MSATPTTVPYWLDPGRIPRLGTVTKDLTVDALIVGGGITGVTAAYLLKKAGATVALLERGRIARVDTGHTTAHLTSVMDSRFSDLTAKFSPAVAKGCWDAGAAAIDQISSHIETEGISCDFAWVPGHLHVPVSSKTSDQVRELRKEEAARPAD